MSSSKKKKSCFKFPSTQEARLEAIRVLGKNVRANATAILKALDHWDADLRTEAAQFLLKIPGSKYIPKILRCIDNRRVAVAAVMKELQRHDDPVVTKYILDYLSHRRFEIRSAAEKVLKAHRNAYASLYKFIFLLQTPSSVKQVIDDLSNKEIVQFIKKVHAPTRDTALRNLRIQNYLKKRGLQDLFAYIKKQEEAYAKAKRLEEEKLKLRSLNISQLGERLGVPSELIGWLIRKWNGIDGLYQAFAIKKKSGGERQLSAPCPRLKYVQRAIYEKVLSQVSLNRACHGFVKQRSIQTNAMPHTGREMVINVDIKDFFPSISSARVYGLFRTINCEPALSRLLTRIVTHNGCLPQGAPTSPTIANLVCRRLDSRLSALAKNMKAAYTRYADDITFSGDIAIRAYLPLILKIIKEEGFTPAPNKIRLIRRGNRQEVTGLTVNEKVSIPRKRRKLLRAMLHHIKTGKSVHWQGKEISQHSVRGHFEYLRSIHPQIGEAYLKRLDEEPE